VSRLIPYKDGTSDFPLRTQAHTRPGVIITEDGEEEWEVERVVDMRKVKSGHRVHTEYLVLWKGYPDHEKTWEPAQHLKNAQDKIKQFKQSRQ
jgi:hypothetical protein